jgi:hypothetical protein
MENSDLSDQNSEENKMKNDNEVSVSFRGILVIMK